MKSLPEKDGRAILMQILSGLRYLHRPLNYSGMYAEVSTTEQSDNATQSPKKRSIIHYDLKPGKISDCDSAEIFDLLILVYCCCCSKHSLR
jgi:serine/threonine protein kinase